MKLAEFDEALLKWGSDLDQWPLDARGEGLLLLKDNQDARLLLEEFHRFNSLTSEATSLDTPDGIISARVQQSLSARIENNGLLDLLPIKKILGYGALAGMGGGVAASILPVGTGISTLLTIAYGGVLL